MCKPVPRSAAIMSGRDRRGFGSIIRRMPDFLALRCRGRSGL
ncbi:hypothetical protein RGUI_1610 [Rhodovulum sp. P5]|nr:hypothetical protein RGUI_1610 [Rhodovulum sp. P5]